MQEQFVQAVESSRENVWSGYGTECPRDVPAGSLLETINMSKLTEAYNARGGNENNELSALRLLLLRHQGSVFPELAIS